MDAIDAQPLPVLICCTMHGNPATPGKPNSLATIAPCAGSPPVSIISLRTAGARLLAECPQLAQLTLLDLRGNPIEPDGALALERSTTLSGRLRLLLSATGLPEDAAVALRQRFG